MIGPVEKDEIVTFYWALKSPFELIGMNFLL